MHPIKQVQTKRQTGMKLLQKQKELAVKVTLNELITLMSFLSDCHTIAFSGPNNYYPVAKEREYYYRWHLTAFAWRVIRLCIVNTGKETTTMVRLKVSEAEQRMLSAMFKRVDCSPYMLQLQERFIKNLLPL